MLTVQLPDKDWPWNTLVRPIYRVAFQRVQQMGVTLVPVYKQLLDIQITQPHVLNIIRKLDHPYMQLSVCLPTRKFPKMKIHVTGCKINQ